MSYKVLTPFLLVFLLHTLSLRAATLEVRRDSVGAERKGNGWLILYKVGAGESLTALARKYHTTVKAIQQANRGLSAGLKAGAIVKVPYTGTSKPATASNTGNAGGAGKKTHTVAAGQGLYAIARIYGVSVADLRTWNSLSSDNLYEGQQLAVSAEGSTAAAEPVSAAQTTVAEEPAAPRKPAPVKTHKVKRNEGLTSIARKYKVSVSDLREWNNLSSNSIKVGKVLRVSPPQQQEAPIPAEPVLATTNVAETRPDNATKTDAKRKSDTKSSVKDGEDEDPTGLQARNEAEVKSEQEYNRKETRAVSNDAVVANTVGFPKVIEAGLAESISDSGDTEGYYALHRSAPVGTILQVRNEMNNLSVFVKVVGKLPDTGANDKLVVKITQKAYERLAAVDRRFRVEVTYLPN